MSIVYRCNRCKVEKGKEKQLVVVKINFEGSHYNWVTDKQFIDLCKGCFRSLKKWVKAGLV